MIDKVDRPDPNRSYRVGATKETKEDQHQGRQGQQDNEDAPGKEINTSKWEKFHRSVTTIKTSHVNKNRIEELLYRDVMLRRGSATLLATIKWTNGQSTDSALLHLPRVEHYLKLKSFQQGQKVPEEFWATQEDIEIGIPHKNEHSGSFAREQTVTKKPQANKAAPKKETNWLKLILFILASGILFFILAQAI